MCRVSNKTRIKNIKLIHVVKQSNATLFPFPVQDTTLYYSLPLDITAINLSYFKRAAQTQPENDSKNLSNKAWRRKPSDEYRETHILSYTLQEWTLIHITNLKSWHTAQSEIITPISIYTVHFGIVLILIVTLDKQVQPAIYDKIWNV
jgi:hypothetical protein